MNELFTVVLVDAELSHRIDFLCLDHFDTISFLVNHQPILLSLNHLCVLIELPNLLVLFHLIVELRLIAQIGTAACLHMLPLLFLFFPLSLNDFKEHVTVLSLGFLETSIVISELLLSIYVQPCKFCVVLDSLDLLSCTILKFRLFKCFLGPDLVKFSCAVLSALLKLSKSLGLLFFFFFQALGLTNFGFFSLTPLTLVLHNLGVKLLFSLDSLFLLILRVLVGDFDLIVEDSDTFALLCHQFLLILLKLLNVLHRDFFLTLSHLLILVALLLTRSDLVDENLCTTLASKCSSLLSLELLLDSLKTFDFHHGVKSLLFCHPVFLEKQILSLLLVTDGVDF